MAVAATGSPQDLILIYFSGHGAKSSYAQLPGLPEGIFIGMHDDKGDDRGLIPTNWLTQWLAPARARHVLVVLDF